MSMRDAYEKVVCDEEFNPSENVCCHPYPHDVVQDWIYSWRFASGRVDTKKYHYPSRYYQVSVMKVRCPQCGHKWNKFMIWHWLRSGYSLINSENDKEFYPALKAIVKKKFATRLTKFNVIRHEDSWYPDNE